MSCNRGREGRGGGEFVACPVHYRKLNVAFWAASSVLTCGALMLVWYLSTLQTEVVDVVGP